MFKNNVVLTIFKNYMSSTINDLVFVDFKRLRLIQITEVALKLCYVDIYEDNSNLFALWLPDINT